MFVKSSAQSSALLDSKNDLMLIEPFDDVARVTLREMPVNCVSLTLAFGVTFEP
jgi:hypothetical protein